MPENKLQIRNSTVDFLVFTKDAHEEGIEVRVQDHNVWLTQKAIGQLFDVDRSVVTKHLKKIFESGKLDDKSTCAFFAQVADNGKIYRYKFYALPAIIAVGYLDYVTRQARRHVPMTMADWASKLDAFLQFNDAEILQDKGKVTAAIAKAFAESEFEQYRVIQDRLYQSDFDKLIAAAQEDEKSKNIGAPPLFIGWSTSRLPNCFSK